MSPESQPPALPAGTLYVVATPIGNLEDVSARALRILKEVDCIACEDTRRTLQLLSHFLIRTPVESYHQFSERRKLDHFLDLLCGGKSVALVSDAGTPTLSDPGALLVRACRTAGIAVVPVPGASALLAAVSSSSFAGEPFLFLGFLPAKSRQRREVLQSLVDYPFVLAFHESPLHTLPCLKDLCEVFGDRRAYIGRELTKRFEESLEGRLSELMALLSDREIRGEITLLVAGATPTAPESVSLETAVAEACRLIQREGLSTREACRRAAQGAFPIRDLYREVTRRLHGGKERES